MADDPEYWFARRSNSGLNRSQYAVLHWKGFVLLFFGVLTALAFLVGGIYLLTLAMAKSQSWLVQGVAGVSGVVSIAISLWMVMRINREKAERTDPELLAHEYRTKLFGSLLGK